MHAAGYQTGYFGKYMNGLGQEPRYVAPGKPSWLRDLPMLDRRRVRRELEGKLEELQALDDRIGKTLAC